MTASDLRAAVEQRLDAAARGGFVGYATSRYINASGHDCPAGGVGASSSVTVSARSPAISGTIGRLLPGPVPPRRSVDTSRRLVHSLDLASDGG